MIRAILITIVFLAGMAFGYYLLHPAISAREAKRAAVKIQLRCEERFAEYPREKGKKLIEGIKKCREVAGLDMEGKK